MVPASAVPSLLWLVAADGSGDSLDRNIPATRGASDTELVLDLGLLCNQAGYVDVQASVHACETDANPNGTCAAVVCDLANTGVHQTPILIRSLVNDPN